MSNNKKISLPNNSEESSKSSPDEGQTLRGAPKITGTSKNNGDVKAAAANLIRKFYIQLQSGCGNNLCTNPNCASSGLFGPLSSNDAAVKALQLFTEKAELCESINSSSQNLNKKISDNSDSLSSIRIENEIPSYVCDSEMDACLIESTASSSKPKTSHTLRASASSDSNLDSFIGLTEERLETTINECNITNNYASLRILLRTIFSNVTILKSSFLASDLPSKTKKNECKGSNYIKMRKSISERESLSKEELRALEMDLDKDVDCQEDKQLMDVDQDQLIKTPTISTKCKETYALPVCQNRTPISSIDSCIDSSKPFDKSAIDLDSLKRSYDMLYKVPETEFSSTLMDAIRHLLKDNLAIQLKVFSQIFKTDSSLINIFIILLENPTLSATDFTEEVLGDLCKVIAQLGVEQQAILVKHVARWEISRVHRFLQSLHQLITIQLLSTEFSRDFTINDEDIITSATQVMKIIYYVSMYKGELDYPLLKNLHLTKPPLLSVAKQDHFNRSRNVGIGKPPPWDPLGEALGIHQLDVKKSAIPLEEFYDDFLSDQLEMDRDFAYYKAGVVSQFSFLNYPFILTPATKALGLYYDNRIRMYSERRMSIFQTVIEGMHVNPYLNLRIRRDHIIEDALVELELVSTENPLDLKKQLVVEFEGEQGIDEGGVSKEFFQLIVEQIFNPDYAMFCFNEETQTFWFNPTSFESEGQFILVGIVLGLAIYNNVILDLHFPPVMYKKLCGKPGSFHDLKEWNTTLHRTLQELCDYEGDDMADTFMQTFRVGYHDIFGASLHHDLKPDGDNIFVTQENKEEFVQKYTDFLINESVEIQFAAFKKGFAMVTEDSPLEHLFRPDELELLVCGSQHYDFLELRKSTEYDGGYTAESPIINWFWDLVDELKAEEKKQLLQFTTGSARVPVGGLARLKLVIARHGPDSERLPTAHTCFNVLLLPEYSSKEKLKERLLKAITYAQGFGML